MRFPTPQREQLTRLANPATIDAVLRWNYQQLTTSPDDNDFYYDPHTARYTGKQHVLKGWCANIRWADKLINSDYIHTAKGHPIYFEYIHRPWVKNPAIRQIIVRATNPRGNPAASAPTAEEKKEIARYRNAVKRYQKYRQARALKIETLHQQVQLPTSVSMSKPNITSIVLFIAQTSGMV